MAFYALLCLGLIFDAASDSADSFTRNNVLDQYDSYFPIQRSRISRIGAALSELMRNLPSVRVFTRPADRNTSKCFITPNRESWVKLSTISVV